jgi:hypothetical protein
MTFPAFRHDVHTFNFIGVPSIFVRTLCKLGFQRRLVRFWACETECPTLGFLPHISHELAIFSQCLSSVQVSQFTPNPFFVKRFLAGFGIFIFGPNASFCLSFAFEQRQLIL